MPFTEIHYPAARLIDQEANRVLRQRCSVGGGRESFCFSSDIGCLYPATRGSIPCLIGCVCLIRRRPLAGVAWMGTARIDPGGNAGSMPLFISSPVFDLAAWDRRA